MGFPRQEYWSGLPFSSPEDLPDPGLEPRSPALQADSLPTELQGNPIFSWALMNKHRWYNHREKCLQTQEIIQYTQHMPLINFLSDNFQYFSISSSLPVETLPCFFSMNSDWVLSSLPMTIALHKVFLTYLTWMKFLFWHYFLWWPPHSPTQVTHF